MATTKKVKNEEAEVEAEATAEVTEEVAEVTEVTEEAEETKPAVDPGEEMVEVFVETVRGGDNSDIYVAVNDRNWLIKRGETVKVPRMAAEVLKHSREVTAGLIKLEEKNSFE